MSATTIEGDGARRRRFMRLDLPVRPGSLAPVATALAPPGLRPRPLPVQPELQERATRPPTNPTRFALQSAIGPTRGTSDGRVGNRVAKWEKVGYGAVKQSTGLAGGPPPPPPPPPPFWREEP